MKLIESLKNIGFPINLIDDEWSGAWGIGQKTLFNKKQLGGYFERMSMGVHKGVGDKTHKYKLDDAAFLNEETMHPDG